jgi:hypothetical protein
MTCSEFVRWLDDGLPQGAAASAARAHAAACPRCAAALAAAREIDRLLEAPVTFAPAGLADSVMMRVAAIESVLAAHPRATLAAGSFAIDTTQAWWVRAAAQPAAALALTLAAFVLWQRDALSLHGVALIANASGWIARALEARMFTNRFGMPAMLRMPDAFAQPEVMLGFAIAITPVLAWVSRSLWRWAERRV